MTQRFFKVGIPNIQLGVETHGSQPKKNTWFAANKTHSHKLLAAQKHRYQKSVWLLYRKKVFKRKNGRVRTDNWKTVIESDKQLGKIRVSKKAPHEERSICSD